jgi:hypothetical protein
MQLARAFARDAEGVADLRPGTRVPIAKPKDHFRPYGTRVASWDELALNLVDAGRDEARHDLRRQCRPTSSRLFFRHLWDPIGDRGSGIGDRDRDRGSGMTSYLGI